MSALFYIIFEDGTKFEGGNLQETKWKDIPDKKIRAIFYCKPNGDYMRLSNFKRIYHMVEVAKDLNGINRGKNVIEYTHLLFERNNKIVHHKMNVKTFQISILEYNLNNDFVKKLNPVYWRNGNESI